MKIKTSLTVDPELWEKVKAAAEKWAEREGIPAGRVTSMWASRALRRAAEEEERAG